MRPRALAAALITVVVVALTAPAVAAHVTVQPPTAEAGAYAKLTFRVPNERPTSGTVQLRVAMPEDHPFASVSVKPVPGWTADVVRTPLATPIEAHGREITDAVTEVSWSGGVIEPGQFQEFEVSVGPLPDDVARLEFPAIQVYASGEEVAWIQPEVEGQPEPERPAPVLDLVGAEDDGRGGGSTTDQADGARTDVEATPISATDDDAGSSTLAIVGLVVAVAALGTAIAAIASARGSRRTGR
jgi:uncharacterized protein